jgi:hypothetical protein
MHTSAELDRPSPFGGVGRPTLEESERRRVEFVRLIASGVPLVEAVTTSRIQPLRALSVLDAPEMRELLLHAVAS